MPWPKGKPRKGYVKKDGTPHAAKGKVPKADPIVVKPAPVVVVVKEEIPENHPELWGMKGNGAISEPCPNCMYAYADGGYCPECGWSKPVYREPYGTYSGGKY